VLAAGGGIDALIRSYNHAKAAGVVSDARFELILEGPEGDGQDTRAFFEDPTSATTKQRAALAKLGLAAADVADFLSASRLLRSSTRDTPLTQLARTS
jgi:hypothetical protein